MTKNKPVIKKNIFNRIFINNLLLSNMIILKNKMFKFN